MLLVPFLTPLTKVPDLSHVMITPEQISFVEQGHGQWSEKQASILTLSYKYFIIKYYPLRNQKNMNPFSEQQFSVTNTTCNA